MNMKFREHLAELPKDRDFAEAWRKASRGNIKEIRKLGYCQICGSRRNLEVHHIRTRGAGGRDVPENLVLLCAYHHRLVQDHIIDLANCELLSSDVPGYEELIQRALDCLDREKEMRWTLGAICAVLTDILGVKRGDLAATFNCSSQYVSDLIRTWRAFPEESVRNPELTWRHHLLAAKTDDPPGWLAKASDNQWSTREMEVALKAAKQKAEPEEGAHMERAKRALNLVNSILQAGGAVAQWLAGELRKSLGV